MIAVSTFSGIGGFDLALERAGIEVTTTIEIDDKARGVLHDHWPNTTHLSDITEVRNVEADVLVGGFPCQDLSVAGRRAGLDGARSGLYFEFLRLAQQARPSWIILENVPGLLSSGGRRDFGVVVSTLADRGYRLAWRVLDAQHFGVPQRRRRIFIVGHLGDGADPGKVLLEPEGRGGNPAPRRQEEQEVAGTLGGGSGNRGWSSDTDRMTFIPSTSMCLSTRSERYDAETQTSFIPSETSVRRLTPLECERLQGFPDGWTVTSNGASQGDSHRYKQIGNAVAVPVVEWIARRLVKEALS